MENSAAIKKPTVFLSHAATDEPIVRVLHDEITRIFANGVDVFATSVPGKVVPGSDWLSNINAQLRKASAVIVLITPVSLNRPWIWFEVGASWSKMEDGQGRILPVVVGRIKRRALFVRVPPLALGDGVRESLGLYQHIKLAFNAGESPRKLLVRRFSHELTIRAAPDNARWPRLRLALDDERRAALERDEQH